MIRRSHEHITSTTFLLLAAAVGAAYAFYLSYNSYKPHLPNKISLPVFQDELSPTPTPTIAPAKPQETSQISPDGKKLLTMTTTTNKDYSKTYSFVTSDADGTNQHAIYSETYNSDTMSIPFNTWSPDDNYVFVTHTTPSANEAIVLHANGDPMTTTEPAINLTTTFTEKITNNTYDETTGWASETLLIVNTKKSDGTEGTSYWFEIPSNAIIPLSTQF